MTLVVVVVLAAVLVVPTAIGQVQRQRVGCGGVKSDVAHLAKAFARLRVDTGSTSAACLATFDNLTSPVATAACGATLPLCSAPTTKPGASCWNGPYVPRIQNDPWDRPYTVELDPETYAITVRSNGANRVFDAKGGDDVSYVQ